MLSRTTEIALFPRIQTIKRVSQEYSRMPVFKSITAFSSKPSLDGTEEIQVSSTHKINLKEAFEQLGNFLNVSVNADSKWSFPELKTDVPLQTWVGALAYACGLRDFNETRQDMFRFLLGANGDASVFGVLFWDAVNAVKVAVLLSNYGINDDASSTQPIAIYEGGGDSSSIDAAIDDAEFIQEITVSGKWTLRLKVGSSEVPTDAVMTSAAITVKAGDNINASATTLAVTVGGSPSFNTVNKYLRDAVISVAYNAAVTFSAQNSTVVVRKSADIDTVTASSGKKVYTIHWSPLAVQNDIVSRWEAYVNVAVYV